MISVTYMFSRVSPARHFCTILGLMVSLSTINSATADTPEPVEIKVVVAAMFEDGEPTGDDAGELQFWVERSKIVKEYPFPLGEYPLFLTAEDVLIICVGGGIPNATASIMAVGLDSRFDLSKAYWLIAGIAGGDPLDMSLGSAAWARAVVDGDLLYEIDAREMPDHWPYGYIPLGAEEPADEPQDIYTGWTLDTISFTLNQPLVSWAYELTKNVEIPDAPGIKEFRKLFSGYTNAQKPPFVTVGETISASTYWHGELLNNWANDWVKVYAGEQMNFMTSNMEDGGTLTALHRLKRTGLVDAERVLILRTASNYTLPPKGEDAAWSTTAPYPDDGVPALEAAYLVGSKVVNELTANWEQYREQIPGS